MSQNLHIWQTAHPLLLKVASDSQAAWASSGAFQNISAFLGHWSDQLSNQISDTFAGPNEYLSSKLGASPAVLYSSLAGAAAVALMSRYNWPPSREAMSPYASQAGGHGVPRVTDDDFSYITSEDLEDTMPAPPRTYDPLARQPQPNHIEDDMLTIRSEKDVNYPVRFPAYSIGDGKLLVKDVRDRAAIVMDLSERRGRRIKMFYKGRELREPGRPVRDYGVKNKSELLVRVPEGKLSDEDEDSSGSAEEVVVNDSREEQKRRKKKNNKNRKKKTKDQGGPHDSTASLEVPSQASGGDMDREGRRLSPNPSRHASRVPSPAVPAGPMEKLEAIRKHFETEFVPLCDQFSANPPKDPKKLVDEHRKISETILQHVLLKLDEVETGGDPEIRARRKDLVNYVHDVFKQIDRHLPEGNKPNR
ncbi:BAG domain-containing protein [Xylariaceae sp. FL0804]|nr:BAG domain-containing protein [Xylariaceae sp. FL0804]